MRRGERVALLADGAHHVGDDAAEAGADEDEDREAPAGRHGHSSLPQATGNAGCYLTLSLEVLDAQLSFDGVIRAFATRTDPLVIALGLGTGPSYHHSLTLSLLSKRPPHPYA
ncbi:DUF475 domain-containing protein, partial [Actinomadura sp. BRA 177]|nr:DUF475 domain-containing protein [Actinomadura sp. BRA 177]